MIKNSTEIRVRLMHVNGFVDVSKKKEKKTTNKERKRRMKMDLD